MTAATTARPGAGPGRQLWLLVRGPGRSTTRRLLLGLLAGVLALSVLVFATGLLTFTRVHDTADAVRDGTVPVIGEIAAARSALVRADRAAITNFTAGGAALSGPGEEFQNQIAVASQNLARVAEHNMAGAAGSSVLQLVEGLLVTYTGLVGQADAQFRQPDGAALGAVDLWNASRLLHKADGGIVPQLDALRDAQEAVLDRQLAGTAMTPGAALVLFVPAAALLALLLVTNLLFGRRFRRRVNPWLVVAAVLVLGFTGSCAQVIGSQRHLEDTRGALHGLVADARAQDAAFDAEGQHALLDLVARTACADPGGCGDTFARFRGDVGRLTAPGTRMDEAVLAQRTRNVTEQAAAAGAGAGLRPWLYLLAIALAATAFLGFRARLNEYRYRPR